MDSKKTTTAKPKKTARGTPSWSKLPPKPASPREILTHRAPNELNNAIRIFVFDDPGPGGANHHYQIEIAARHGTQVLDVQFQKGPVQEQGVNGGSIEALAAVVIDRLEGFQSGPYACDNNADALAHFTAGLEILKARTAGRQARGVEGTSTV